MFGHHCDMQVLQAMGLIGYGGFLGATFGWRTLRSKRATGESGWREPISRTDAVGETVCVTGCILSLVAPPLAMAGAVRPLRTAWVPAQGFASVTMLGLGTVLAIWAQRHLAGQWRAGVEASDSLVTSGPFVSVRNPFYLGCFLASASVLVAVPSAVALAGVALHIVAAEIIVRVSRNRSWPGPTAPPSRATSSRPDARARRRT